MNKQNNSAPPPWLEAPDWANYRGQQKEGDWYWFSHKPTVTNKGFTFGYRLDIVSRKANWFNSVNPNWKSTLEKRPSNE
jgi:hypothetical protein